MDKILFIARKEVFHILRDPKSLMIAFLLPILMVFLYGYAINMDIENVILGTVDLDQTAESRALIEQFYASTYFSPSPEAVDLSDPERLLRSSRAHAILILPPGFGEALRTGKAYEIGMTIDGADAQLAAAVQSYSAVALAAFYRQQSPAGAALSGVTLSPQVLYNPDLKSAHFFVPGLIAVLLMMISALLPSITIAREKETGTMEQLLTFVWLFAWLVFGVPTEGSYLILLGFGFVYVSTALSIGIFISSIVKTQQLAMMVALTATLLPSVMLSGFIFAIKNMPLVLQALSRIVPATYFVVIIRGVMLKGTELMILLPQALAMIGLMVLFMVIAALNFKTRIE